MSTTPTTVGHGAARVTVTRTSPAIMLLCGAALIFEGYDIYVFGVAVPSLLQHPGWTLSPGYAGVIGSAAVFGMLLGALVAGMFTDIIGRRRIYLATVTVFSLGMLLCAVAPTPEVLLVGRLIVGIGGGGFMPTALSMVVEFSPEGRRNLNVSLALVGVGLGGILSALLGIWLVPAWGYRALFWIGVLPLLILLPFALRRLPESVSFLVSKGRIAAAREQIHRFRLPLELTEIPGAQPVTGRERPFAAAGSLFGRRHLRATVVFWVGTALCLLLMFGTNTWLPSLMMKSGYGISSALSFLVFLNLGAVLGSLAGAAVADRVGPKYVVIAGFCSAALALAALSQQPAPALVYLLVVFVGAGGAGTQNLLNSYMATYYPPSNRGSGLGLALAFGRIGGVVGPIYGGLIVASGAGTATGFLAFALAPVVAALVLTFGPRVPGRAAS
ncbi:MFS transporter [Amycolatopsis tucumanensis]|uniref:MFS transporter n=1 Tax=Amycolatopsis tucumanensis TaxID=401106 RepID=UPI003D75C2A1